MGLLNRLRQIIQGKLVSHDDWDSPSVGADDPVMYTAPLTAEQHWAFKVLEVSEEASREEIRRAYLRLSKNYHPDNFTRQNEKAQMANKLMTKINRAYELLTS